MATKDKAISNGSETKEKPYTLRTYCFSNGSIDTFEKKYDEVVKLAKRNKMRVPSRSDLASMLFDKAAKVKPEDLFINK